MSREDVIDILYSNLGAVPHDEFGVVNLFPFMVEDEATNALKRAVAQGLSSVLESAGVLSQPQSNEPPARAIQIQCRSCSTTLFTTSVSHGGTANVPAANVISALSRLRTECPHKEYTADDHRRLIEQALQESQQHE
ncbi:hypothetical protein [Mycobacterium phage WXIN]|nr:hypothetical protein [Mycobacterium phage WXIN]